MTPSQIIFLIAAAWTLLSAVMVVSTRNLVHAALWLVAALFGVAVLFALLDAGFLAVVQVVVYIGAIAIMFIFAVMLTRREMRDQGPQHNPGWWAAVLIAVLTFAGLLVVLIGWGAAGTAYPQPLAGTDSLATLANALISPDAFALPFEVASVLLLAALIGAVYVAMNKK